MVSDQRSGEAEADVNRMLQIPGCSSSLRNRLSLPPAVNITTVTDVPAMAVCYAAYSPLSGLRHMFPPLQGVLRAGGSLPKGATWPKGRTFPRDSHIVTGGGVQGQLWRPDHLVSKDDNSEVIPIAPSSRAYYGISWGLGSVCTVEQLSPLLGSFPSPPTAVDPTGIPDRLPAHKPSFQDLTNLS